MNKSQKIISAILTIALGVLLIAMRGEMISVFMTILGVALIVLGTIELIQKYVTQAVIKIVVGGLIILFGWTLVSAVVYIIAAFVLIVGILGLYDCLRYCVKCLRGMEIVKEIAIPATCILIGLTLFFNAWDWIFIVAGILTIIEGGLILQDALNKK